MGVDLKQNLSIGWLAGWLAFPQAEIFPDKRVVVDQNVSRQFEGIDRAAHLHGGRTVKVSAMPDRIRGEADTGSMMIIGVERQDAGG